MSTETSNKTDCAFKGETSTGVDSSLNTHSSREAIDREKREQSGEIIGVIDNTLNCPQIEGSISPNQSVVQNANKLEGSKEKIVIVLPKEERSEDIQVNGVLSADCESGDASGKIKTQGKDHIEEDFEKREYCKDVVHRRTEVKTQEHSGGELSTVCEREDVLGEEPIAEKEQVNENSDIRDSSKSTTESKGGNLTQTGSVDSHAEGEINDKGSADSHVENEINDKGSADSHVQGEINDKDSTDSHVRSEINDRGRTDSHVQGEVINKGNESPKDANEDVNSVKSATINSENLLNNSVIEDTKVVTTERAVHGEQECTDSIETNETDNSSGKQENKDVVANSLKTDKTGISTDIFESVGSIKYLDTNNESDGAKETANESNETDVNGHIKDNIVTDKRHPFEQIDTSDSTKEDISSQKNADLNKSNEINSENSTDTAESPRHDPEKATEDTVDESLGHNINVKESNENTPKNLSDVNDETSGVTETPTKENRQIDASSDNKNEPNKENTEGHFDHDEEAEVRKELEKLYEKVLSGDDTTEIRTSSAPESTHESDRGYSTELVIHTEIKNGEEVYEDDFEEVETETALIDGETLVEQDSDNTKEIVEGEDLARKESENSTAESAKQHHLEQLEQNIQNAKVNWETSINEGKANTDTEENKVDSDDSVEDTEFKEVIRDISEIPKEDDSDVDTSIVVIEGEGPPRVVLTTASDRPPSSSEPDIDGNRDPTSELVETADQDTCKTDDTKESEESEIHKPEAVVSVNEVSEPGESGKGQSEADVSENVSGKAQDSIEQTTTEPQKTIDTERKMEEQKRDEQVESANESKTQEQSEGIKTEGNEAPDINVDTEKDDFYDDDVEDSKQQTATGQEHTNKQESIKSDAKQNVEDKRETNNDKTENCSRSETPKNEPEMTEEQLALERIVQKEESPLDQLLKRHVEIDGSVESISGLENAVTSLLGSMKDVMIYYQDRLKLQALKDFTVDLGKFRGDFSSINDAYKRCTAMSVAVNQQLKELRALTNDVRSQISRKFQNEDLNTWIDSSPEQEKEKYKLQELAVAAEKASMAKAAEAKHAMATASVGVAQSQQFVTEMEAQYIETESTAGKAASQAEAAIIAAEEARKAAEERRKAEEAAKKRAEERARIKAEEQKKKKASEEMKIIEQAAIKGSSVEDERKQFMEEKARKDAERRNPKNWPRYTYNMAAGDFDPGVGCIIRAIEGSMRKTDITCVFIDQSTNVLKLQDQEELVSNIVTVNQVEEDRRLSFEEPFSIALPVSNTRLPLGKEAVIKQLMPDGKWKPLPTTDIQFEDYRELRFVEGRCRRFGTFVATLTTRKDTVQFPPKGGKSVSSVDSRISFTNKPGTFKHTVSGTVEVHVIDVNAVSDLKVRTQNDCDGLLTASPFINFSVLNKNFEKPIIVTMPLPQNQTRLKRPSTGLTRESRQPDARPATARATTIKDDEEEDVIHFLYLDEKNGWTKDAKCTLHQPKNKDVVSFEMGKPRSRFVLLRTKPGIKDVRVEKLAGLLERSTSQRNVKLYLRQRNDDPIDIKVGCTLSNKIHRALKVVEEDEGYTEGPSPSTDLILQEGQELYLKFRGNMKCVTENPNLTLMFNSHIRVTRQLFVEELDKFAQKGLQNYRGFLQVLTKAMIPRAIEPGAPASKGHPPEMVEAEILLCELLIELPKPEAEPPKPLQTAPLSLREGPLTSDVLRYIAGYLGKEWKDLAVHLNLKPMRIQAILRQNVNKDTPQTRFDMLMAWAKRIPKSVDKVQMLCSALQNVGRTDLVEEVRYRGDQFKHKRQLNARSSHLRQAFVKVAKTATVFKNWQKFAKGLGVPDDDIIKIEESGGSGQEKCFNSLESWKQRQGEQANVSELATHLRASKHDPLSREVESIMAV